jgi:hypothetical protein
MLKILKAKKRRLNEKLVRPACLVVGEGLPQEILLQRQFQFINYLKIKQWKKVKVTLQVHWSPEPL